MTRDERIAQIRAWERSAKATALFDIYADVRFLLAELDAAKVTAFTACPNCGAGLDDGQCRECIESDAWLREQNAMLKARVQRLTEALRRLTEPICSIQRDNGIIRERLLAIAGDDAMDRYKDALAAIAEGADTRG